MSVEFFNTHLLCTSGLSVRFIAFLNRDSCGIVWIAEMFIAECPSAGYIWWIICDKVIGKN